MKLSMKLLALFVLSSSLLFSKGILAGTKIINIATLQYNMGSGNFATQSNTLIDVVDQLIDLKLECQMLEPFTVQKGATRQALPIVLKNIGNGMDKFSLSTESNTTSSQVDNPLVYTDNNGNGIFDSNDIQVNDINVSADGEVLLFFVSDIPNAATWLDSDNGIEAKSTIGGSGVPGQIYDRGAYFAVDGFKGGVDKAFCTYKMSAMSVALEKTATLSSDKAYKGSIIHYKIVAKVLGTGTASDIVIKDAVPVGTTYVASSMKLDGYLLTDTGHIVSGVITVPVSNMTEADTHLLEFDVEID